MESDTHLLYFTKLSGKSQDFYFLVGIHLKFDEWLWYYSQLLLTPRKDTIVFSHKYCINGYIVCSLASATSIQGLYSLSGRTLTTRSREASKPRDSSLDFSNHSWIWQAPRQQRCRDSCQILERYDHYNIQSRGFETLRDLAVRRLTT